jgi:ferrochelatase
MALARAATPGTHPRFVSMITELVMERAGGPRRALGSLPPAPGTCAAGCCRPRARL